MERPLPITLSSSRALVLGGCLPVVARLDLFVAGRAAGGESSTGAFACAAYGSDGSARFAGPATGTPGEAVGDRAVDVVNDDRAADGATS